MERVSARDGDIGVDAAIFYTLEDAGNSLIDGNLSFVINSTTGEIFVDVASLDRETHSSYSLTVQVSLFSHSKMMFLIRSPMHTHAGCTG